MDYFKDVPNINEAKGLKAIDVSSGVHGPKGFPDVDIPPVLLSRVASVLHGGGKDIMKVWKRENGIWSFQVAAKNFSIRHQDLKNMVKAGLIGIQYEPPKSMMLFMQT